MKSTSKRQFVFFLILGTMLIGQFVSSAEPSPQPPPKQAKVETPVDTSDPVANSIVKIFSKIRVPDAYRPWTKDSPREYTGTGVVIKGKRILSNAHVVLYASEIEVLANLSGDKIRATVEFVAPGIDLAILKLEDESFFDTHRPLVFSESIP
ncbi:MAG: peptidase, partial [Verrucomicrobiales bacterium]|nr:peptidase [Verrucomicrobiales bacterium]